MLHTGNRLEYRSAGPRCVAELQRLDGDDIRERMPGRGGVAVLASRSS